jgi:hypothetical protein
MSTTITDPHTKLRLLSQCLSQKIAHLLSCGVLYHYNTDKLPPDWTNWNGPLKAATNNNNARFLSDIIGIPVLPHQALLNAQLSLNAGGLGIVDPWTHAIPNFVLTFTTSTQHATGSGIYLNKQLNNVQLHPTPPFLHSAQPQLIHIPSS